MAQINFLEEIARQKVGGLPEWRACIWERIGPDATKIEGGVTAPITRGKRKGQPKWGKRSEFDACVVTDAEVQAAKAKYESETGRCAECQGSGQVWAGWSVSEGTRMRDCSTCQATGEATH